MPKTVKVLLFITLAPLTIGFELFLINSAFQPKELPQIRTENTLPRTSLISPMIYPSRVFASLPEIPAETAESIITNDSRPIIIQQYLERHNSQMTPFDEIASIIVDVSDKYGLDWRLLVAIAQQESSLGKNMPENCFNAWGYGIHSRGTLCFGNWQEAIETVAKGLKSRYIDKGLVTPEQIMSKYTPSSSGSWAQAVDSFLEHVGSGG